MVEIAIDSIFKKENKYTGNPEEDYLTLRNLLGSMEHSLKNGMVSPAQRSDFLEIYLSANHMLNEDQKKKLEEWWERVKNHEKYKQLFGDDVHPIDHNDPAEYIGF